VRSVNRSVLPREQSGGSTPQDAGSVIQRPFHAREQRTFGVWAILPCVSIARNLARYPDTRSAVWHV